MAVRTFSRGLRHAISIGLADVGGALECRLKLGIWGRLRLMIVPSSRLPPVTKMPRDIPQATRRFVLHSALSSPRRIPMTLMGTVSAIRAAKHPKGRAENRALLPLDGLAPILDMREINSQRWQPPAPFSLLTVICNMHFSAPRLVGPPWTLPFRWEIPLGPSTTLYLPWISKVCP